MNTIKACVYGLLLMGFTISAFSSCKKELDLDEETLVKIEKQEKMVKLDELFELAFTDPAQAEDRYNCFVLEELITENRNFLTDKDLSEKNVLVGLAIDLNKNYADATAKSYQSLFDLYKGKFAGDALNKTLLTDIPARFQKEEFRNLFTKRIEELNAFFDKQIEATWKNSSIDQAIVDKNWKFQNFVFSPDFSMIYFVNFDFTLKNDRSIDMNGFFFLPHIPHNLGEALVAVTDEKEFFDFKSQVSPLLLSPLEYAIKGNKISFFFHLKNDYDVVETTGKLERYWYYEYEYEMDGNTLTLKNPRLLFYMPPLYIKEMQYDQTVFEEKYFDGIKEFKLTTQ